MKNFAVIFALLLALLFFVTNPQVARAASNTPTNLVATPGDGSVSLTWTPAAGSSYSDVFEPTSANGPFQSVGKVTDATSGDSFSLNDVSHNVTYYFYVVPIGAGTQSATVSAIVSLPAPKARVLAGSGTP